MPQTAYDLEPVLRAVARTTAACLGYGTAVINLYRPAWDDFHTVVVEGSDEARRLLLGQTSTADDWVDLLDAWWKPSWMSSRPPPARVKRGSARRLCELAQRGTFWANRLGGGSDARLRADHRAASGRRGARSAPW